jgi:hypothetical protein
MTKLLKKMFLVVVIVVAVGVFGYVALYVYDRIAQPIIESKIREAGLNPDDYDLRGIAPWNIRRFVRNQEIIKAGLNPKDYDVKGKLTADEVRKKVTGQAIIQQLAEYDLTVNDVDLSDLDLFNLSAEEIREEVYQKILKKIETKSFYEKFR